MARTAACITLAAACLAATAAEPPAGLVDRLVECTRVADNLARLTCFDREAAPLAVAGAPRTAAPAASPPQPPQVAAPPQASTIPPPQPPAAARSEPPSFGEEQLKDRAPDISGDTTLEARIASTRRGGQGTYLITLDNGQVWRHEEGSQADYLVAGAAVTITRAAMGSYRLSLSAGKSKNWVRVTRVR